MEIGFSQDVLIDIGLNAAGFFLGGTIIMLIASFWKSRRTAVEISSGAAVVMPEPAPTLPKEKVQRAEKSDFKGEFVNFNNMNWQSEKTKPTTKTESTGSGRDRQQVIKMARQMLADKRDDSELRADLPVTDGELAYAKYLEKLSNAGRK